MKIQHTYPPNIGRIRAVMGDRFLVQHADAYFCYGDVIYIPSGGKISASEIAHEHTHSIRQGEDPDAWWEQWLTNMEFRILEELIAHRVEYRVAVKGANRAQRRAALSGIAARLSGPMYGRAMSIKTAKHLIGEEALTDADMIAQGLKCECGAYIPSPDGRCNMPACPHLTKRVTGCVPPGTEVDVPDETFAVTEEAWDKLLPREAA